MELFLNREEGFLVFRGINITNTIDVVNNIIDDINKNKNNNNNLSITTNNYLNNNINNSKNNNNFNKDNNNITINIDGNVVIKQEIKTIHHIPIKTERLDIIEEGLDYIVNELHYSFSAFVIDGRRGLIRLLERKYSNTPIQMCIYHFKAIIRRYLTNNPKLPCSIDIKNLVSNIQNMTKEEFISSFNHILNEYKDFINEKSIIKISRNKEINKGRNKRKCGKDNKNKKGNIDTDIDTNLNINLNDIDIKEQILLRDKHQRLLSAIRTIKYYIPYLFTYKEDKYKHLCIPSTNNYCEGKFGSIKRQIKGKCGISKDKRDNFFIEKIYTSNYRTIKVNVDDIVKDIIKC